MHIWQIYYSVYKSAASAAIWEGIAINEPQRVIHRLLQLAGMDVHRTKLVKLIYFTDYIYHQHEGRTLTGLKYMWDNFGPNAISNRIVIEADVLAKRELIRIKPQPNASGETSYLYRAEPDAPAEKLDPLAEAIMADVLAKYRSYTPARIVNASKKTPPFEHAQMGDVLDFHPSKFDARKPWGELADDSGQKTLEEVCAELGIA